MKIAVIMTCFNRKDKTLRCLQSLFVIVKDVAVYLTDDGCTDGTSQAIEDLFPTQVKVIHGQGNLFWSRGMWLAWTKALKGDYDYYIWLNDDVVLYPFFLDELMKCHQIGGEYSIVSGLIETQDHQKILYGGSTKDGKLILSSEQPQQITYMNGNVVLVPKCVIGKIGIIDPIFHHDLGDVDYGLTAIEHGIKVLTTRKPIAYGYPNGVCRVRKWNSNIVGRFKKLNTPLGSPLQLNFYFRKKHFGVMHAFLYCLKLIILNILPDKFVVFIWGETYKNKI